MGWPPRALRLDGVDSGHVAWLLGLKGERTLAEALADGADQGLRLPTMRRLLGAGIVSGLVDDAAAIPATLREVPAHLRDLLAGDLAAARHLHGGTPAAREVIDRRRAAEIAVQGQGAVADVVGMVLTAAGVGTVVRERATHSASKRHRRGATERTCHVLCDAAHPDAAADPDAMALDIPHLAVTAAGTQAVIGPLVIPGRTSCLRCRDLHLADRDPAWTRIAVQWSARRPAPVAAALAHVCGAWAALMVLALVDAGPGEVQVPTLDAAVIVSLPGATLAQEPRPPHPLCGCLWPDTGSGTAPRGRRRP